MVTGKLCNVCNDYLELVNFSEHHKAKDGRRRTCNVCLEGIPQTRQQKRAPIKAQKKVIKKIEKEVLSDEDKYLKKLINDFPTFLEYVYSYIGLGKPTSGQNRIAEILGENPKELILQAPRGVGKSWITGIFGTWRLLRNPDEKILIVSGTSGLSEDVSKFMRRLLHDVPLLKHLEPTSDMSDSVIKWNVRGCKPAIVKSVSAVGIGGHIVGKRATLVIADDVEIPSNSQTQVMREKLMKQVGEFSNILIPDMPGSVIFLGTPQSEESVYSKLPYKRIIIPARVPENIEVYQGALDPWVLKQGPVGTTIDERLNDEALKEKLSKIGWAAYLLQYMQDISLSDSDKYPLKQSDLIVTSLDKLLAPINLTYGKGKDHQIKELDNIGFSGDYLYAPSWIDTRREKYDNIVMGIDPSGSGSDETSWAVIGTKNGFVFVLDVGGTVDGYSEKSLLTLAMKAKEYKVNKIIPEKNMGSGMFAVLLEKILMKIYPCQIEKEFTSKGQKELRIINNIEPLLTNHQMVIDYGLIESDITLSKTDLKSSVYSLVYQLTHITKDRGCLVHDDRLDALAIACEYIKDSVFIDADFMIKQAEEEEMKRFLYENIYNKGNSNNNRSFRSFK